MSSKGAGPGQHAGRERDPEQHDRAEVDRVLERDVGHHAAGDLAGLHAGAVKRPRGHRHAAGACGGDQPDRGDPGEWDLQAGAPVQPRHVAAEDGAEEQRVSADRKQLDAGGRREPERISALQAPPGLVEAGELGQQQVERGQGDDDQDAGDEDAPAAEQRARRRPPGGRMLRGNGLRFGVILWHPAALLPAPAPRHAQAPRSAVLARAPSGYTAPWAELGRHTREHVHARTCQVL